MISFGSCIYPTLGSVKVSPSRVASPENYKHQTLKVSGVTPRPELPPITLLCARVIPFPIPLLYYLWLCVLSMHITGLETASREQTTQYNFERHIRVAIFGRMSAAATTEDCIIYGRINHR